MPLWARMIQPPPDRRGRMQKRRTAIADENGIFHQWDSSDQTWTKVTDAHGKILRDCRLQPWRQNQPLVFDVYTADEVDRATREYEATKYARSRRQVPSRANARDLTPSAKSSDGRQGTPTEKFQPPKSELEVIAERLAKNEQEMEQLRDINARLLQRLGEPIPNANLNSREEALGLGDDLVEVELVEGQEPDTQPPPDLEPAFDLPELEAEAEPAFEPEPTPEPQPGDLPVAVIRGIGHRISGALSGMGISTIGELASADPGDVAEEISKSVQVVPERVLTWIEEAERLSSQSE